MEELNTEHLKNRLMIDAGKLVGEYFANGEPLGLIYEHLGFFTRKYVARLPELYIIDQEAAQDIYENILTIFAYYGFNKQATTNYINNTNPFKTV